MQIAKMLKSLNKGVKCLLKTNLSAVYGPKVAFHNTNLLFKQKKGRDPLDCVETKTLECKNLNPRKCSPTDPPIRPCSESECPPKPRESCCVSTRLSKDVCQEDKSSQHENEWRSMWATPKNKKDSLAVMWNYPPECCPKCENERFDILYYRPSDKYREYQRTWWECCPRMVPKRVCSYCDAIPPEISRRCLPICPRSACTQDHEKKRFDCLNAKAKDCMRLTQAQLHPRHCGI